MTALLRQLVSAGVRWKRLLSSTCLTRKSATSARENSRRSVDRNSL